MYMTHYMENDMKLMLLEEQVHVILQYSHINALRKYAQFQAK